MPRKVVAASDLLTFFNYAIANADQMLNGCRDCHVTAIERRQAQPGRSNWSYRFTCKTPENCDVALDKIAREIGAIYDLE